MSARVGAPPLRRRPLHRTVRALSTLAIAVALLLLAAPPALAIAKRLPDGTVRLQYNKAPLKDIVIEIAKATGETLIVDPGLAGRFTITVGRPVTKGEALALLDSALLLQGMAVLVGDDGARKVLQITDASNGSAWAGPEGLAADRDNLVTTMIALEKADAEKVIQRIAHMVDPNDSALAYPRTNSVVFSGTERRVRNMIELTQALDAGGQEDLWVRTLRYRDALNVSEMLRVALEPAGAALKDLRQETPARIWADERTNSILMVATESQLERARALVAGIDQQPGVDTRIQVVRIYHRDVVELQQILQAMAEGRASASSQALADLGAGFTTAADEATNSIIIDAEPRTFKTLLGVIASLDRPQPRIQVDVTVYEITNPSRLRLGVDWFLPILEPNSDGSGNIMTVGSNPSGGGLRGEIGEDITFFGRASRDPLLIPFTDENGNVTDVLLPRETVVITADSRQANVRSLMQPRLLMVAGEEQRLFAGQNIPIPVGNTGGEATALSGVQVRQQIERQDVGVELRATGRLGVEGEVELDLLIEMSRVAPSEAGPVSLVGPTLDDRRIETTVALADGELAVIGLSQEAGRQEDEAGTPFLKDIPVLGRAFKSGGSRDVDVHVIFAVQARRLDTPEEDLAESMRQRLAIERSLSKVQGVRRNDKHPYAVLVTTRETREAAQELADSFERDGYRAQVGHWESYGAPRFDVYLTGYARLHAAGAAAMRISDRGFDPEVVVLPGDISLAKSPGLRLLGAHGLP